MHLTVDNVVNKILYSSANNNFDMAFALLEHVVYDLKLNINENFEGMTPLQKIIYQVHEKGSLIWSGN